MSSSHTCFIYLFVYNCFILVLCVYACDEVPANRGSDSACIVVTELSYITTIPPPTLYLPSPSFLRLCATSDVRMR